MPHIVIKIFSGSKKEDLKSAAKEMQDIIEKVLKKPKKYTSVSLEEYSLFEWQEVYNKSIRDADLLIEPGYTNPNTFE